MYLLASPSIHASLLTEGGSGGHMNHPFDLDWIKTGMDLLDFFTVKIPRYFEEGNTASIKTDGVNVSFKLVSSTNVIGEVRKEFAVDRGSKKPIDIEGITIDRIGERFAEGHGMREAVLNLLTILNNTLQDGNIQEELEMLGMWDNPDLFLNTEYVLEKDDKPMNVIKYDEDFIAIHGVFEFFEEPSPSGRTMQRKSRKFGTNKTKDVALDSLVRKIRNFSKVFNVYGPRDVYAVPKGGMPKINYDRALGTQISIKTSGENTKTDTLGGWLRNPSVINPYEDTIITATGRKIYALHKDVYFSVVLDKMPVSEFLGTDDPANMQMAINTMNGAIFWHATRLLGNTVLDAFSSPLGRQGAREHEGLVLNSNEIFGTPKDVKLTGDFIETGAFGRISQLVTTDKTVPAQDEAPDTAAIGIRRTVAIVPGAYKPPHRGHLEMVKHYASLAETVYIFISKLARGGSNGQQKVDFTQSKQIWNLFLRAEGITNVNVIDRPSEWNSPVKMAYEFSENRKDEEGLAQIGDVIIFGASEKLDRKGRPDWERFGGAENYVRDGAVAANTETHVSPVFDELSATDFRKALSAGDLETIRVFLPNSVIEKGLESEILSILNIEEPEPEEVLPNEPEPLLEVLSRFVEETINERKKYMEMDGLQDGVSEDKEEIAEMSGMGAGGGSAEGYAGPVDEDEVIEEDEEENPIIEQVANYLLQKEYQYA